MRLVAAGAQAAGLPEAAVGRLARTLLQPPARAVFGAGGISGLNADGSPLQLCLSLSPAGIAWRLLADPASHCADSSRRLRLSLAAMRQSLEATDSASLALPLERLLAAFGPGPGCPAETFTYGFLWLGAGLSGPGIAAYVDTGWRELRQAWSAARGWLAAETGRLPTLLDALEPVCRLSSVGIEGRSPGEARLKLYSRFLPGADLAALGPHLPFHQSPWVGSALAAIMGTGGVSREGALLCVGFSAADGRLVDAKIDVSGAELGLTPADTQNAVDRCRALLGLPEVRLAELMERHRLTVSFMGLGTTTTGGNRLNVYLKPGNAQARPFVRTRLAPAIEAAAEALLRLRDADGGWHDYDLPVGPSDQWVTAVAGLALAEADRARPMPRAAAAARAAAGRLTENRSYRAGWGYNGRTGPDADTTAHVLLLLTTLGIAVSDADIAFLAAHRRADGGFATFLSDNAWGLSHPCVSPVAALALAACGRPDAAAAAAYASASRGDDDLWPSYWWDSRFYATWHNLVLQRRLGLRLHFPAPACRAESVSLFDLIWLTGIAAVMGAGSAGDTLGALLSARLPTGGWPGQPVLRVTEPDCRSPWVEPRGRCYTDRRGVLTTACALRVLVYLEAKLPTA